ncbi:MAG: phosphate ABC transporter substrate-binding protein [Myxococcota bacterium]|jgi:phosphate transport system substrate-binding protein|nr:phosphate ABC transporter substrate-binding protein [Myxococcota bacterium]
MRVALVCVIGLFACAGATRRAERNAAHTVTLRGSDTMVVLCQRWAQAFREARPDLSVQVGGGGSGVGIAALLNGTTDLAAASRDVEPSELDGLRERGGAPIVLRVAVDALAVYVHEDNALPSLDVASLRALYRGRATHWSDVGRSDASRVVLYGRENSSGTYVYFKEHVLDRFDFAAETQSLPGTAAVIQAVRHDPKGIGYGGFGFAHGVRLVPIAPTRGEPAVVPDERTAIDGSYPLARFLYLVLSDAPTGATRDLVTWVLSDEGQAEVAGAGFFPLPAEVREAERAKLEASAADPADSIEASAADPADSIEASR